MHTFYLIGFGFCLLLFLGSRYVMRHPEAAGKVMWWAPRYANEYARQIARFFWIMSICGMALYLIGLVTAII